MTPSEAGQVLTVASGYDNRTVGTDEMILWAEALPGVRLEDARRAVIQHYTASTDWLKPAHINTIVGAWNRERARAVPPVDPPRELADDPRTEAAWVRAWQDAHIAGHTADRAREIANRQFGVDEDEQRAIDAGPAAGLKAQMERDLLELSRKQSLAESERRDAIAAKRERAMKIRESELALATTRRAASVTSPPEATTADDEGNQR